MRSLIQDVTYALRALRRHPGHAAAAVLTLALGIGASTAVFSVVNAVLLRPLPYPEPERLVDVLAVHLERSPQRVGITPADFLAWREESTSFEQLGAYVPFGTLDLTGDGEPVRLSRHLVSEGLLEALAVQPVRGRLFGPEEYRDGRAILLSHRLWRARFGGDPTVVGRSLTLGDGPYEVVGVLPEGFRIPGGQPDVLIPLVFAPGDAADRDAAYLGGIGRLRPGVSLEQAETELGGIAGRAARQLSADRRAPGAGILPLAQVFIGPAWTPLVVIFGAVLFVLLIACANLANLQLVRAVSREPELVLRAALGADARRLARQLLTESVLLALLGGAFGLLVAVALLAVFPDVRGVYLPRNVELGPDLRVFGFGLALSLLTGLASGLVPAFKAARGDLHAALQAGGRGTAGGRRRLHDALVVVEVGLALVLLTGAGLLLRSFTNLLAQDPGFEPANLLTLEVSLPESRYPEPRQAAAFYSELLGRIEELPGVVAAGAAKELPPDDAWGFQPEVEGREPAEDDSARWQLVTAGCFAALRSPVLQGETFTARDREGGRLVMVASRSAARRFLPADDPLGARVRFNGAWYEVVGIVEDQKAPGVADEALPVFYVAHAQLPVPADAMRTMSLAIRTEGDPLQLAGAVRQALWSLDRNLPAAGLQTMEQRLAAATVLARSRFNTALVALFAGLALALALVGLYGVLSHLVHRRVRELGVRMALGAARADLFKLVLSHGLLLTLGGLAAGLLGALALTRVLASLLYGIGSFDPATFGLVALGLGATAALACYLPARRASRLDPLAALREE